MAAISSRVSAAAMVMGSFMPNMYLRNLKGAISYVGIIGQTLRAKSKINLKLSIFHHNKVNFALFRLANGVKRATNRHYPFAYTRCPFRYRYAYFHRRRIMPRRASKQGGRAGNGAQSRYQKAGINRAIKTGWHCRSR